MSAYKINKSNFKQEVLEENGTVMIDFFAPWCSPCKMLSPVVDKIAEEYKGSVKVGKVNIDEDPELAQEFGVMSVPTLIVMKDGKVLNRSVGLKSQKEIEKMILS
ncbi:MAG: thioredoxin [Eubacteriales bacterium]|nr:thioredoxin [Eubacteriales bacterium]